MKFTPSNIANALRKQGIPISKRFQDVKINGVEVSQWAGSMMFEYRNWDRKGNRQEEIEKIISALNAMGYDVKEFAKGGNGRTVKEGEKGTGAYKIFRP